MSPHPDVHGIQPQRDGHGKNLQGSPATLGHGWTGEVGLKLWDTHVSAQACVWGWADTCTVEGVYALTIRSVVPQLFFSCQEPPYCL